MQDKTKHSTHSRQGGFFERNNFYFGKLMTARDFTAEQEYFNEKRWMVNRFGLGWGVLCGLKVRPHDHHKEKVIVEPGFAIDPYGHEIMVCREEIVSLTAADDDCPPDEAIERPHLYYVWIKYEECAVNPSPFPIDSCDGYKEECVYNRIREGYRIVVSRERPDLATDDHDCFRFLQDPSPAISNACPERPECEPVPLASICYNPTTATTVMDIDMSMANRKLAFSNELLYELIRCSQEAEADRAGRLDRAQHVPLLASTIRGLKFRDGKIAKLDHSNGFEAKYPFRLTSDGQYIWVTDRDDKQVWRIHRKTNKAIKDEKHLCLDDAAWGIAYDGTYVWMTHHESFQDGGGPEHGKLTRVNVSTLKRHTFVAMPKCETLPDCYRYPEHEGAPQVRRLRPHPGEIVLHGDGHIYVAHGSRKPNVPHNQQQGENEAEQRPHHVEKGYKLSVSRIDPVKGCIVEVIDVDEGDNREPWSRIRAMASDGSSLWIAYRASSRDRTSARIVVRRISKDENGHSVVGKPHRLRNGAVPEHMVFDGTRLWVSHNDGVSVVDVQSGKEVKAIDSEARHSALAYGGRELLWAALPGAREASINWINIFSRRSEQWMELVDLESQQAEGFEISDMQFDGDYIYVAYHLKVGQVRKGMIHRLLP